ncbi:MAG: response regulator, partial [Candidatus Eisenbacteria bacterium]
METRVLVADDEPTIRETCSRVLQRLGFSPVAASSGNQAIDAAREQNISLAVLDIRMPGKDGIAVLRELKSSKPSARVIMITAHGSLDSAVQAMRLGAADYLMKPFSIRELEESVRRVFSPPLKHTRQLEEKVEFYNLVGQSAAMMELRRMIELVSTSDVTALIVGETGTGKELVA